MTISEKADEWFFRQSKWCAEPNGRMTIWIVVFVWALAVLLADEWLFRVATAAYLAIRAAFAVMTCFKKTAAEP